MIKRLICVLLLLSIFVSQPVYVHANTEELRTYRCLSNISDDTFLEIYEYNGSFYIHPDAAAQFSGFNVEKNMDTVTFTSPLFDSYSCSEPLVYAGKQWIPFEATMEALQTQIGNIGSVLTLTAKRHSQQELLEAAHNYMSGYAYQVQGATDWELSRMVMCDIVFSGGLLNRLTGEHDETLYKSILSTVLDGETVSLPTWKQINMLDKYLTMCADMEVSNSIVSIDYNFWLNIQDAHTVKNMYSDSVKSITKEVTGTIGISGLDIQSQLAIYNYINSIVSANQTYLKMVTDSYYQNDQLALGCLPYEARVAVENIHSFVAGDGYYDVATLYLSEEAKQIVNSLANDGIAYLMNALLENASGTVPVNLLRKGMKTIFADGFDLLEQGETITALAQLQKGLRNGYYTCTHFETPEAMSSNDFLRLRALTALYLRYYQIGLALLSKQNIVPSSLSKDISKDIAYLLDFSDFDIVEVVKNYKFSPEGLVSYTNQDAFCSIDIRWNGKDDNGKCIVLEPSMEVTQGAEPSIIIYKESDTRYSYCSNAGEILATVTEQLSNDEGHIRIELFDYRSTYNIGLDCDITQHDMHFGAFGLAEAICEVSLFGNTVIQGEVERYRAYTGYWYGGICKIENGILMPFQAS